MGFINMGGSQESTDGSEFGGLVMDQRSQSSTSSYESNPEPPAPLRLGQQRPGRPPFRTQLSEPNCGGLYGPSPVASLLQHHHSSIVSPDSELSAESHSTGAIALFSPQHFRHEPFSVFYGTGAGIGSAAAAAFCCGQLSSLIIEHEQGDSIDRSPTLAEETSLAPSPFIFSPSACAWLTRLFQKKALSPELREELIGEMLQMHTVHFDKNRRSSLAPNQPDFGSQSGQGVQLSPYGPDSLFFCIGQAGSMKNSFAGPSPTSGQQCFFTGMNGGGGGSVAAELGQQQGQKQQKRKRAVITMDAQNTQILIASDSVCRLFGFRDRSLIGKKFAEVFPAVKSPWDVPDGTKGPLLLQNVLFTDFERQKRLKPVYGKPVDILDADGQRSTLSIWSYPLASASTAAAAPRKNSAILLRSPSVFLPSFMPFPSTTRSSAVVLIQPPTSANAPINGPSAASFGEGNGGGRASHLPQATKIAECPSSTKVSPSALYAHNHSNSQQRNLNNLNSSSAYLGGQNSTIDLISSTQSSQRTLHKSSSLSSTNSSQCIPIVGYAPQLKEVLEEEQQQNNCDQKSQPSKSTEAEQKGLPKLSTFELNEPERSAEPSGLHCQSATKQPTGAVFCDFHQEATTSTATSSQGTTMVQAGIPIRTNPATNRLNNNHHHHNSNGTYRKESAEEEAIVIIPINRAEMDASNANQTESQQKGFLRRQYHCEILANTFASSPTNSSKTIAMAIGRKCNNNNEGDEATTITALTNGQQTQLMMNGHSSASVHHNGQKGGGGDGQQQQNDRWLLLMEPLPALIASVILGAKGRIFRVDDAFPAVASILGYESTNRLLGMEIQRLIPSLNIGAEWDAKEQYCCGSTVKHNGVPLMATTKATRDQESGVVFSYEVQIRSIASISGVFMLTEMGAIYSHNENLFHELLGMELESDEHNKLEITDLIPYFFEYLEVAHFHLHHHQQDNQNQQQNGKEQHQKENNQPRHSSSSAEPGPSTSFMPTVSHSSSCLFTQELATARRAFGRRSNSFYGNGMPLMREDQAEVEEHNDEQKKRSQQHHQCKRPEIIPGIFYGLIRHVDGMMIPVKIEVSNLENHQSVNGGQRLFAICIGFDRTMDWGISQLSEEEEQAKAHQNLQQGPHQQHEPSPSASNNRTLGELKKKPFCVLSDSSTTFLVDSIGRPHFSIGGRDCDSESAVDFVAGAIGGKIVTDDYLMHSAEMKLQEVSLGPLGMEDENNEAVRGEYSKHYDTFQLLGNGAFGSVKLAARKDTGLLTVTKFIYKAKVLPESWVPSSKRGNRMVPIEVHLLENLYHSNIVRVLDVFENDKYYQLVMEKYGSGMDLFEFIDHKPKLDEPLISYIFRQIVSAVDYLHHNHIVHRDLKDENVIIDQNFCCKLIDFGSAAFFGEGIVFSTFCGTMEYCSPEVLTGNKYLGPELEMWSMGILLYTLVYFENPFRSAQETVHADIELPWEISEGLYQVMNWLLQPDPKLRATVSEIKSHWWLTQQVDSRRYSFKELLKNCERAQVVPPLYVSDLHNHLKNGSASCSNLASMSIASQLNAETATTTKNGTAADGQPKQQMGIVSAR